MLENDDYNDDDSDNLLSCSVVDRAGNPIGICLLKVDNRNTRARCEICSKLTWKTPDRCYWCRSGIFINFEDIPRCLVKTLYSARTVVKSARLNAKEIRAYNTRSTSFFCSWRLNIDLYSNFLNTAIHTYKNRSADCQFSVIYSDIIEIIYENKHHYRYLCIRLIYLCPEICCRRFPMLVLYLMIYSDDDVNQEAIAEDV